MRYEQISSLQVPSVVCVLCSNPPRKAFAICCLKSTRGYCATTYFYLSRKRLIPYAEHIEPNTVVQQLHLERLVRNDTRRRMQRYRIPSHLNSRSRHFVMLKELPSRIRTVHLEAIALTAELLQQTKIMERRTDK